MEIVTRKRYRVEGFCFCFCFCLLFTFENDGNLFCVYQNGNFLPGKSISRREKNQEKTLPPQKNMPVTPLLGDRVGGSESFTASKGGGGQKV